jgi:hypothetical protein
LLAFNPESGERFVCLYLSLDSLKLLMKRKRRTTMTTIHVQLIGDKALLLHSELERLVALAQQSEEIKVQIHEDDVSTLSLMRLAEQSGAFDFWKEEGEDIYTAEDGEPI